MVGGMVYLPFIQRDGVVGPIKQLFIDLLHGALQRECLAARAGASVVAWLSSQGNTSIKSSPKVEASLSHDYTAALQPARQK